MSDGKRKQSHSSSSSDSSDYDKQTNKKLKKLKKEAKRKLKKQHKLEKKIIKNEKKRLKREKKSLETDSTKRGISSEEVCVGPSVDKINISKARAPMTKEEWEIQQSVVRRVFHKETNRYRLIKGTGELLEECVSKERHKTINKQATRGDGDFFQSTMSSKISRS